MRAAIHVLSILVLLPYAVMAGGFLMLTHAVGRGSIWSFLDALVNAANWLLSWGGIAVFCIAVVLIVLGFFPQHRWLAALFGCVVAGATLLVLIVVPISRLTGGQILFLVPCGVVMILEAWLAHQEWPFRTMIQGSA